MGGGSNPCYENLVNLQMPAGKLPYNVIFTCIWVSNTPAGTQKHHPSQMEVMISGGLTPAGIIHGAPMLCPTCH